MNRTGSVEATGRSDVLGIDMVSMGTEMTSEEVRSPSNRHSQNRVRTPRPPQSSTVLGRFLLVESSVAGNGHVIIGNPHQDERTIQTRSIAPVEAEIVEDDLQERRELEAQLRRVLEERENAVVAQVVDQNQLLWTNTRRWYQRIAALPLTAGPNVASVSFFPEQYFWLFLLLQLVSPLHSPDEEVELLHRLEQVELHHRLLQRKLLMTDLLQFSLRRQIKLLCPTASAGNFVLHLAAADNYNLQNLYPNGRRHSFPCLTTTVSCGRPMIRLFTQPRLMVQLDCSVLMMELVLEHSSPVVMVLSLFPATVK